MKGELNNIVNFLMRKGEKVLAAEGESNKGGANQHTHQRMTSKLPRHKLWAVDVVRILFYSI